MQKMEKKISNICKLSIVNIEGGYTTENDIKEDSTTEICTAQLYSAC